MALFKVQVDGVTSDELHQAMNSAIHQAIPVALAGVDLAEFRDDSLVSQWTTEGFVGTTDLNRLAAAADKTEGRRSLGGAPTRRGTFEITLDGIELPDDVAEQISAAIQRAVLPYLADLDLAAEHAPVVDLRPREWRGLVAHDVALGNLP